MYRITMSLTGIHKLIISFEHKGLGRFFRTGDCSGLPAKFSTRIERMLDRLDASSKPEDMHIPGYKFHPLSGNRKGEFSVTVTGNWRITFRFDGENAIDVNFEDYH